MNKIKIFIIILGAVLISSCSSSKPNTSLEILHNCNGTVCSVELGVVNSTVSTDFLGKEHIFNKKIVKSTESNITWSGINNYTTNTVLSDAGLLAQCEDEQCTANSNPTGGVFLAGQSVSVSVSGTITVNGVTTSVSNYTVGGNWVVPQPDMPVSLTYTCPAGATDGVTYSVPSTSGISMVQTGTGVDCKMSFRCPVGYVLATNAPSLALGTSIRGSQLEGVDGEAATGNTRVVLYNIYQNSPRVDINNGVYDPSLPVYRNSFSLVEHTNTRVSCYPQ
jgi:hypothetical protein